MKKLFVAIVIGLALYGFLAHTPNVVPPQERQPYTADDPLTRAYRNRQSNVQVRGAGVVSRVFPDDTKGSRHQKFIVRLPSGQTLLISHNIDLAPRIESLHQGDTVEFYGEYEWNEKGGVVHWTHHDPTRRHVGGWLRHKGISYQ